MYSCTLILWGLIYVQELDTRIQHEYLNLATKSVMSNYYYYFYYY